LLLLGTTVGNKDGVIAVVGLADLTVGFEVGATVGAKVSAKEGGKVGCIEGLAVGA
jgi:hypothetical protein